MTIRELIDEQDIATEHGDTIEVRLAIQPRWAFEYAVGCVAVCDPEDTDDEEDEDSDDDEGTNGEEQEPVVYIGEGSQLGYLPGQAARVLGWSDR